MTKLLKLEEEEDKEIIKSLIDFEIDFKILNKFVDLIKIHIDNDDYHKLEMTNLIVSNHVKNFSYWDMIFDIWYY